ncbi:uridine kinase [Deinococcus actinosclerus]|uniref:Uridine kinase n=1 Tax=Deinococcus actinosclerus TaxID=1768108 RepID=A0ABM5X7Q1_9DEIO|nr:uridine kinase [Deinococcus actinosclerus]
MNGPQSQDREGVLAWLAARWAALPADPVARVAVDGVDGAGKTTLADELAGRVRALGRPVIRVSTDGFHQPRAARYARGRTSPEGFYRDSYDLAALAREVLSPLSPGGTRRYRTSVFDVTRDEPVPGPALAAAPDSLLIVDGLFLHRPELRGWWHDSVFLRVPFAVSVPRGAARGPGFGSPDPAAASNRRYVAGNELYFHEADPEAQAGVVLDYTDLTAPRVVTAR